MSRRAWVTAGAIGAALLALVWVAGQYGVFTTAEDLDRRAAALDGGVPEGWPFDGVELADGGVPDAPAGSHSLAVAGRATIGLHDFTMNDQQEREVLRIRALTGTLDLGALQRGAYQLTEARIEGAVVKLYRDESGRLSVANALKEEPPPVRMALDLPPTEEPEGAQAGNHWLLEIGPIQVRDTTVVLGFTEKPVVFHIDRATVMVRRGLEDEAPTIYLNDVQGEMVKPKPLPQAVRIAHATGRIRLAGHPMVDLSARTCIGGAELRARAIVPAKKKPVEMTVDSSGVAGALGRMGLKIAARRKEDKLRYAHGPVKIEGGLDCDDEPVEEEEAAAEDDQAKRDGPSEERGEAPAKAEPDREEKQEEKEEEREDRQEEKEEKREDKQEEKDEKREDRQEEKAEAQEEGPERKND